MTDKERYLQIINQMNNQSLTEHMIRVVISIGLVLILFSLFEPLTLRGVLDMLYIVIVWDILFHFLTPMKIYYLRAALANVIIAGFLIFLKVYFH